MAKSCWNKLHPVSSLSSSVWWESLAANSITGFLHDWCTFLLRYMQGSAEVIRLGAPFATCAAVSGSGVLPPVRRYFHGTGAAIIANYNLPEYRLLLDEVLEVSPDGLKSHYLSASSDLNS